ncbi:MAG: hypothetical protein GEU94_03625 [Micromonosporaceae bacterium]|nr:hypothetical protein [Micromonosporaceae bacterium]
MTLADHLRGLPDDKLAALLRARPDLALPVPADVSALAARAQSRLSTARALEGLDRFTLEILDALRLLGDAASVEAVIALVAGGAPEAAVRRAIDALRERALTYPEDGSLRVPPVVEECCAPYPAGLGRPGADLDATAGELVADPAALRNALRAAPEAARRVLDRLAAGPPVGTVASARQPVAEKPAEKPAEQTPVRWLITRRLLTPVGEDTVELPREIGLLLRREAGSPPLGELHPEPPPHEASLRDPESVDAAGSGQAMEAIRQTEALLEALAAEPAAVLRSGGVGVRDLRRLARVAGVGDAVAALLLETAAAAGLLDDDREAAPQWLPTAAYDRWRVSDLAPRWVALADTWLTMTRQPGLVGQREDRTSPERTPGSERGSARDRPINALSGEADRIATPPVRRAVLGRLAEFPEGAAPSDDELIAQLAWRTPRRGGRLRDDTVRWTSAQAAALGVTGLGALTSYGRLLLTSESVDVTATLAKLLPAPVDHVLVQADLTVVAPGPPEPALAAELSLAAERESSGGATVYRVTPGSVRRALDAGMAAEDLHALFRKRSLTPAPQALTYLIDDTARRHGGIRVGSAGAYLRSDDEARLAEVLADRRLAHLSLRRLAPTVLITPYLPARLLATLRDAGYAPAAEDTAGAVVLARPDAPRASGRTPAPSQEPGLDRARAEAAVAALRRGDAAARVARRAPVATRPADAASVTETLAVLRQALQAGSRVWVGYVDSHGGNASRLVTPVSMSSGYLRAEDGRTEMAHTFALHRITSATPAD